jgi:hypothetical protein
MSEKRLMNEQLPTPTSRPTSPARDRVLKHLREVMGAGATMALAAGCTPFAVVDPLPPPAKCRDVGSVHDALTVSATEVSGASRAVLLTLTPVDGAGVTFTPGALALNGTSIVSERITSASASITLEPPAGQRELTVQVKATCTDFRATFATQDVVMTYVLTLPANAMAGAKVPFSVSEEALPSDAGP